MIRKFIRKKILEVLKGAKIQEVGDDVFSRKTSNHDDGSLPYIIVYPNSEAADRFDEAPKRYKRSFDVVIEYISSHDSDDLLSDELDDASYQIEAAIESNKILQGLEDLFPGQCLEDTEITNVQYDMQSEGSSPIGAVRMTYSITYIDRPYTEKLYNTLSKVETEWKIGEHLSNKAIDSVTLP